MSGIGNSAPRRRFLRTAALTMASIQCGIWDADAAVEPRELAAIARATEWLNSPRLTAADLSGKVVLVDFWTYTCINWLRTLPYIRAWVQKYGQDVVVIGVHTPEFEFEQNVDNVRRAVQQMRIEYPVVIDNDYSIWRAFDNYSWPALYFIDQRGRVRRSHAGEGDYVASEQAIQRLVGEMRSGTVAQGVVSGEASGVEAAADWSNLRSPENYVGYARAKNFSSPGGTKSDRRQRYTTPTRLRLNQWALDGEWTVGKQATVLNAHSGRIAYRFHARDLHLVMGPSQPGASVRFRVSIDGQPPGPAHGGDVDAGGNGVVVDPRLYHLIRGPMPIVDRQFDIEFFDAGVETFAFTFG